jgi:hypothetical protein
MRIRVRRKLSAIQKLGLMSPDFSIPSFEDGWTSRSERLTRSDVVWIRHDAKYRLSSEEMSR